MREILVRAMNDGRLPNVAGAASTVEPSLAGMGSTSSRCSAGEDNGTQRRLAALRANAGVAVLTHLPVKES
jgi:hypothetical protein